MIEVKRIKDGDPLEFDITVRDAKGASHHHVTIERKTCEKLGGAAHTPERVLEASFRFLLDREPKESILRRFDVSVIARYFPEFEQRAAALFVKLGPAARVSSVSAWSSTVAMMVVMVAMDSRAAARANERRPSRDPSGRHASQSLRRDPRRSSRVASHSRNASRRDTRNRAGR